MGWVDGMGGWEDMSGGAEADDSVETVGKKSTSRSSAEAYICIKYLRTLAKAGCYSDEALTMHKSQQRKVDLITAVTHVQKKHATFDCQNKKMRKFR